MENLLKNWQLLKHNLEETNIRKLVKSYYMKGDLWKAIKKLICKKYSTIK